MEQPSTNSHTNRQPLLGAFESKRCHTPPHLQSTRLQTRRTPQDPPPSTHIDQQLEQAAILVERLQNLVLSSDTADAPCAPPPPTPRDGVCPGVAGGGLRLRVDDALHEAQARRHALPAFHVLQAPTAERWKLLSMSWSVSVLLLSVLRSDKLRAIHESPPATIVFRRNSEGRDEKQVYPRAAKNYEQDDLRATARQRAKEIGTKNTGWPPGADIVHIQEYMADVGIDLHGHLSSKQPRAAKHGASLRPGPLLRPLDARPHPVPPPFSSSLRRARQSRFDSHVEEEHEPLPVNLSFLRRCRRGRTAATEVGHPRLQPAVVAVVGVATIRPGRVAQEEGQCL